MAGDWIKIECVTPNKPEVFELAEILNIDPDAALGKLIRVWIWADEQTLDGNAASVTKALLNRVTAVTGFADAMIKVGWLHDVDGKVSFVNFGRHNGKTAKTRALGNKRTETHRVRNDYVTQMKRECNGGSVTKALPEKRREEKRRDKTNTPPAAELVGFDEFWQSYPRRTARGNAEKAWVNAVKIAPAEKLREAAIAYAACCKDQEPRYIKHPATWLNAKCWDDELPPPVDPKFHADGTPKVAYFHAWDSSTPEGRAAISKHFMENLHKPD